MRCTAPSPFSYLHTCSLYHTHLSDTASDPPSRAAARARGERLRGADGLVVDERDVTAGVFDDFGK